MEGPFPADTLFWRHRQGEFAAIICMYHDQGLIPLKLLHFMDGVNVTLGLPIIRTSVDHGTAYNLAGTGKASPGFPQGRDHDGRGDGEAEVWQVTWGEGAKGRRALPQQNLRTRRPPASTVAAVFVRF